MICQRYHPHADLQPWLAYCWEWRFDKTQVLPEIFPGTGAELLFNLGEDFCITAVSRQGLLRTFPVKSGAATLLCPRHALLRFSLCERGHIISLRLRSAACFEIFAVPLAHICDQVVALDELGITPPETDALLNQGVAALGHWLRQLLAMRSPAELALSRPIEQLYHGLPYTEFKQRVDMNPRTLQRRLLCYLGVDARYFQRTARFQRTLRRLLSGMPLLDTMFDEGYYDQSHFIKNCQFFTQRSPGNLLTPEQITLNHYNMHISRLSGFV